MGNDRGNLNARESSARACSISSNADSTRTTDCPPLDYVGSCTTYCTLDASKTYYTSCVYNGVTYQAHHHAAARGGHLLLRRRRLSDHRELWDSNQYYNCGLDCGACQ